MSSCPLAFLEGKSSIHKCSYFTSQNNNSKRSKNYENSIGLDFTEKYSSSLNSCKPKAKYNLVKIMIFINDFFQRNI